LKNKNITLPGFTLPGRKTAQQDFARGKCAFKDHRKGCQKAIQVDNSNGKAIVNRKTASVNEKIYFPQLAILLF